MITGSPESELVRAETCKYSPDERDDRRIQELERNFPSQSSVLFVFFALKRGAGGLKSTMNSLCRAGSHFDISTSINITIRKVCVTRARGYTSISISTRNGTFSIFLCLCFCNPGPHILFFIFLMLMFDMFMFVLMLMSKCEPACSKNTLVSCIPVMVIQVVTLSRMFRLL